MLRSIEVIKDGGFFDPFRWGPDLPDFERINVIFGANGTGKSSLARALDGLTRERGRWDCASIRMSRPDGGNSRRSNYGYDDEFDQLFVFSDSYVERNHNFSGDTELAAVLTLGERSVEDEKRVAKLRALIEAASEKLTSAATAHRLATKALGEEYTTVARGVVGALRRAGGEYESNGRYSQARVKTRFNETHSEWKLLTDAEETKLLAIVNSDERQPVEVRDPSIVVRDGLRDEVAAVLAAMPVSVVLDTLEAHQEATGWVEDGRGLHQGLDTCIFCHGPLTEARKREIEEHFSHEVEALNRTTDTLLEEVRSELRALDSRLVDPAISGALFEDLRQPFMDAHAETSARLGLLRTWLTELLAGLEKKRANVVAKVEITAPDAPDVDGSEVARRLSQHNQRVAEHASLMAEAAKRVELHHLKRSEPKIEELTGQAKEAEETHQSLEANLQRWRQELAALENVSGDPLPSAKVMASELTRILGRSELSFELLEDGKHYRVTRNGQPACGLSTGERTAITLIHFLENVKHADTRSGKPIVIIDDPVSSLDSGAAVGISTYIWSETVAKEHIEQVFLLTHNFELFRQWDIQIEGLSKARGAGKRYPSKCYELVAPYEGVCNSPRRVPALVLWPPNDAARIKVRSSYHHAFITAAGAHRQLATETSMEKKLDALLLYPNLLRRMLETFLAFKDPTSVGNFTNAMREMGASLEELGYGGDADALRLQLTRFTHANSHADSPETDVAVVPDEIGAVIGAVFSFMNAVDRKHFEGLCEVAGVRTSDLLFETPPIIDHTTPAGEA